MMKMQFSNCLKISETKICCYIRLIHRVTEKIKQNLKDDQKEIVLPEDMKEGN